MKKIVTLFISFTILLLFIFTLNSCKKSSTNSYYVRYKLNDTQINENNEQVGNIELSNTTLGGEFIFYSKGITLSVHDPSGPIKTNVPYAYVTASNIGYNFGETGLTLENYNGHQYDTFYATKPVVTIVITSINSTSVAGTFSGMVGSETVGNPDVNITDGQFVGFRF